MFIGTKIEWNEISIKNKEAGKAVIGMEYFVFGPLLKDKDGQKYPTDEFNIERFKSLYGMIEDEQKNELLVSEIGAKDGGVMTSRYNDFKKTNNDIAEFFLKYLHRFLWNSCSSADGKKFTDTFISKISMGTALKKLDVLINQFNIVNNELLDLKYNTKLSAAVIDRSMQKMKDEYNWKNNPMKKN